MMVLLFSGSLALRIGSRRLASVPRLPVGAESHAPPRDPAVRRYRGPTSPTRGRARPPRRAWRSSLFPRPLGLHLEPRRLGARDVTSTTRAW